MSNAAMREVFEALLLEKGYGQSSLIKNERGEFKDKKIRTLYNGFKLFEKALLQGNIKRIGIWVVAEVRENKSYNFSMHPKWHFSYMEAFTEAERLAREHGKRFAVFKRQHLTDPLSGAEEVPIENKESVSN